MRLLNSNLLLSVLGVGLLSMSACSGDDDTPSPFPTPSPTEAASPTDPIATASPTEPAVSPTQPGVSPTEPAVSPTDGTDVESPTDGTSPVSPTPTPATPTPPTPTPATPFPDDDGDGYQNPNDCDDTNSAINPGAAEVPYSGVDEDCKDGDASDVDGDGNCAIIVDFDYSLTSCTLFSDCNDNDNTIRPGALEVAYDGIDQDCSGVDLVDVDGDGYCPDLSGSASADLQGTDACPNSGLDCDDNSSSTRPGVAELCGDSIDNNCDGGIDDAGDGEVTFYKDEDEDGYGDPTITKSACQVPAGYVTNGDDCDDDASSINPIAPEYCDDEDNNCNGEVDEGSTPDSSEWYLDEDGDEYGTTLEVVLACVPPEGFIGRAGDCDDANANISPEGVELCNDLDDNCDGVIDEDSAEDAATFYADADTDGYGAASNATTSCSKPDGYVTSSGDCDDTSAAVNPAADEVCNSIDDDCDSLKDESDAVDATTWFIDTDKDNYGSSGTTKSACTQPTGFVDNDGDCDDGDPAISPDAKELCDEVDNNCDGVTDDSSAVDATSYYADKDKDTYGDPKAELRACSQPDGYVTDSDDCDDTKSAVNPEATEVCNNLDDDCDGTTDVGAEDASTWYADTDGDNSGNDASTTKACTKPRGYVADNHDCNDSDATVFWGSVTCPINVGGDSCLNILDGGLSHGSAYYTVDPDGSGAEVSYTVLCDMTTAGGGWTLVGSFTPLDNKYNWTQYASDTNNLGNWRNTTTFGSLENYKSADYKSPAFVKVAATDLMAVDSQGNYAAYEGTLNGTSLLSTVTSYTTCQTTLLSGVVVTSNVANMNTYGEVAFYGRDFNEPPSTSGCALGNFRADFTDSAVISLAHNSCGVAGFGQLGWKESGTGKHTDADSFFCLAGNLQPNTAVACGSAGWYGQTSISAFTPSLCTWSLLYVR